MEQSTERLFRCPGRDHDCLDRGRSRAHFRTRRRPEADGRACERDSTHLVRYSKDCDFEQVLSAVRVLAVGPRPLRQTIVYEGETTKPGTCFSGSLFNIPWRSLNIAHELTNKGIDRSWLTIVPLAIKILLTSRHLAHVGFSQRMTLAARPFPPPIKRRLFSLTT